MAIYNNTCCYGCSKSESEIEPQPTKLGSPGVLTCREMNKDSSTSRIGCMSILVNPQWLKARISSNHAPVILDVRWYRDQVGGYDHYLEHHIPNAIYVDLEQDLTGVHNPGNGRRPFPSKKKVQKLTRKWGIDREILCSGLRLCGRDLGGSRVVDSPQRRCRECLLPGWWPTALGARRYAHVDGSRHHSAAR